MMGQNRAEITDVTITNLLARQSGDTLSGDFTLTFHPDNASAGTVVVRAELHNMVKQP